MAFFDPLPSGKKKKKKEQKTQNATIKIIYIIIKKKNKFMVSMYGEESLMRGIGERFKSFGYLAGQSSLSWWIEIGVGLSVDEDKTLRLI